MVLAAAFTILLQSHSPIAEAQRDAASVRQFVQGFYDWYAPLTSLHREDYYDKAPMHSQEETIKARASLFSPTLLASFTKARQRRASVLASGELSVGMAFEPFMGSAFNDNGTFEVRRVVRKGAVWHVEVGPTFDARRGPQEALTVVVEKSKSGFQFSNFIYDEVGWNLVDYLRELTPQPPLPPRRVYENGGLSLSKIRWLRAEELRCIVPTYIPAGMHVSSFEMEPVLDVDDAWIEITYSGKNGSRFMVQMISDGIGDVIIGPDRPIDSKWFSYKWVRNPVLGKMQIESLNLPSDRCFGVNWIDLGEDASPRFVCLTGEKLSTQEAMKIAKGLRFLK